MGERVEFIRNDKSKQIQSEEFVFNRTNSESGNGDVCLRNCAEFGSPM